MSLFSTEHSNAKGIPEQCRDMIKSHAAKGMFDVKSIFGGDKTAFYFLMTQDCNGTCSFCYQPKEFRQKNTSITKEIMDETVRFAVKNFREDKIKFVFFGGEPLLNFPLIKYFVETYPMMKTVLITNGIKIYEDNEILEWLKKQKNSLYLSVSINALKPTVGDNFLEKVRPILDLVKSNGGDIHCVIGDPKEPGLFEEFKYYIDYGIPMVRVSSVRHVNHIDQMVPDYVTLFKKMADYLYFSGDPKFGRIQWDQAIRGNQYMKLKGQELMKLPPTFCGCGYLYLAIDRFGDIYPCDFFANFPEFKIGSLKEGFNEKAFFFTKMKEWVDELYNDCRNCPLGDMRLCPTAMCLAENYMVSGNPLKPSPNHCNRNKIEYEVFKYIAEGLIRNGNDADSRIRLNLSVPHA